MLAAFQCDDGQGYHFCRPIPADAMTKFLLQAALTESGRSFMGEATMRKPSSLVLSYDPNP
jgi:hypothetical protein